MNNKFFKCVALVGAVFLLKIYASCGEDCRRIVDSPVGSILVVTRVEQPQDGEGSLFVYRMNLRIPPTPKDTQPKVKKFTITSDNLFDYKINLGSLEEGDSFKKAPDGSWERAYN